MRITEAECEYLLRTLSDAQLRAAEIAIAVRARVGVDHRLWELGNSTVTQIESVLRDVRRVVEEEPQTREEARIEVEAEAMASTTAPQSAGIPLDPSAAAVDAGPEHWFHVFVNELLERYRASGGITFEAVERLLQERKEAFVRDMEIARKMYRTYPHLLRETPPQHS